MVEQKKKAIEELDRICNKKDIYLICNQEFYKRRILYFKEDSVIIVFLNATEEDIKTFIKAEFF